LEGRRARENAHVVGLFVVETRGPDDRWTACSTRTTASAASACAWELLTREGGEVRIRQGSHVVAEGSRVSHR